jgi:hypothetical protein
MIAGTTQKESAGTPRLSRGETGLAHLTANLQNINFINEVQVSAFIIKTLKTLYGQSIEMPQLTTNRRFGKHTHGRYTYATRMIQISPSYELGTVSHELAHHVNWIANRGRGHGPQFKQVYHRILRHIYEELGQSMPTTPSTTLPPIGTEVIVTSHKHDVYIGIVTKRNRTRCEVRREDGKIWNVPGPMMTWDS